MELFSIFSVILIIIFGDKSSKISGFDLGCLAAVLLIVIFWIFTQNHLVTNFFANAFNVVD